MIFQWGHREEGGVQGYEGGAVWGVQRGVDYPGAPCTTELAVPGRAGSRARGFNENPLFAQDLLREACQLVWTEEKRAHNTLNTPLMGFGSSFFYYKSCP